MVGEQLDTSGVVMGFPIRREGVQFAVRGLTFVLLFIFAVECIPIAQRLVNIIT